MFEDLHERLETRKRAIENWKRLKIVMAILRMCNENFDGTKKIKKDQIEVEKPTFDDRFAKFVINP